MSIKIQFNNEETWTKSLKYMLTNLKWLLAWVVRMEAEQFSTKQKSIQAPENSKPTGAFVPATPAASINNNNIISSTPPKSGTSPAQNPAPAQNPPAPQARSSSRLTMLFSRSAAAANSNNT